MNLHKHAKSAIFKEISDQGFEVVRTALLSTKTTTVTNGINFCGFIVELVISCVSKIIELELPLYIYLYF